MKDRVLAWMALNGPSLGIVALMVVAVFMITGCNTIAGMGTDITRSAEWTKEKMSGSKDQPAPKGGS